jgi:hypothetical protein
MFCGLGRFGVGMFCSWDVLELGPFVLGRFVLGRFVLGRFVLGRFVGAPKLQISDLSDTCAELIRYQTYQILNFSDIKLNRYRTYQILNLSDTELIRCQTIRY